MAFYTSDTIKEIRAQRPKQKIKLPWKPFLILVILGLVGYVVAQNPYVQEKYDLYRCYWDTSIYTTPHGTTGKAVPLLVKTGDSTLTVGQALAQGGLLASPYDFVCYTRKIDAGNKIEAGYYEFTPPITLEQIVPLLQDARTQTATVMIPEGLRMDEIATRIDTALGTNSPVKQFSAAKFLELTSDPTYINTISFAKGRKSLEGFLFPDTYEFAKDATTEQVLTTLLNNYQTKVIKNTQIQSTKGLTDYQVLTLASIIEKEAGKDFTEKQTIAGILIKRLKSNWALEVDATFLYAKKDWKATITAQDKLDKSSYNTYLHAGLPPTPICNPGLDSINAVLSPKDSPYWFYLHGSDGTVHYAKTYAEHMQNISLYLR